MGRRGNGRKVNTRKGKQQKEETKGRYLCVSNGFEIWCLDLNKSPQRKVPVPLPKTSGLNLVGDQLPASVGLFKLKSDVYMIGGQQLLASLKEPMDGYSEMCWGEFPSPLGLYNYKILCNSWGIQGSSRVTYRLSLAEGGTLTLSKSCNIAELNHPKVWPIVEHINGQLHVVESVPCFLEGRRDWNISHEVCNPDGSGWKDILTTEAVHIHSHVVVGDRIYAIAYDEGGKILYYEFDSQTKIWNRCPIKREWLNPSEMKLVWHIIAIGTGRCIGEFPCEGGRERVFVLVAVHDNFDRPAIHAIGTQAVAYLVTLTGRVICYQMLPNFFKKSRVPCNRIAGTMIEVEEEEEGPARAMCSVVSGTLLKEDGEKRDRDYLFVNTFSVEMLPCVGAKVREILEEKARETEVGPGVPLDFVSVTHKDKFIYETDTDYKMGSGGYNGQFVGWRACFL